MSQEELSNTPLGNASQILENLEKLKEIKDTPEMSWRKGLSETPQSLGGINLFGVLVKGLESNDKQSEDLFLAIKNILSGNDIEYIVNNVEKYLKTTDAIGVEDMRELVSPFLPQKLESIEEQIHELESDFEYEGLREWAFAMQDYIGNLNTIFYTAKYIFPKFQTVNLNEDESFQSLKVGLMSVREFFSLYKFNN